MSKNKKVPKPVETKPVPPGPAVVSAPAVYKWHWTSVRVQVLLLTLIGLIFYANTFSNEYALDDNPIIVNNEYVQSGVSGIKNILTGDALESLYKRSNTEGKLSGGRYRPLSMVTFAIEQQLFGLNDPADRAAGKEQSKAYREKLISDMHYRHVVNVFLYIFSVVLLLLFLRQVVFRTSPLAAFVAAFIFLIHPLHTEVVANVKSRDEIMSLLFICLTFITAHRYLRYRRAQDLIYTLTCFFLALMSKEYAAMLLVLLPLSFYYFGDLDGRASFKRTAVYLAPFALYLLVRFSAVAGLSADAGEDVLNNPYVMATAIQKCASIIAVMIDYIKMLFVPYPLSADYSYNQIPYSDFSSPKVWVSLVVYTGLLALMVREIRRKSILGFGLAVYFSFFLLISNVVFNIGAPKGERLIYHSSVGFAIIVGWLLSLLYDKIADIKAARITIAGCCALLLVLSAIIVLPRNTDWKNDVTLFLTDVQKVPNSASANEFAGGACIVKADAATDRQTKDEWLHKAISYIDKAIQIDHKYTDAYVNRGIAYLKLGDFEHAFNDCDTVMLHFPAHPHLQYLSYTVSDHFFNLGLDAYQKGNYDAAFPLFTKALSAAPTDPDLLYNVGFAYFNIRKYDEAHQLATLSLKYDPNNQHARQLLQAVTPVSQ